MRLGLSRFRRINEDYKIRERIGSGSFGDVYRVTARNGIHYAAKFVTYRHANSLVNEREVMQRATASRQHGIPYWHYCGIHGENYVLIMDLFGKSLYSLSLKYGYLNVKTALSIGIQITSRIEALHNRGYIHRDIKPGNIVIGKEGEDRKCLYLIDYGLAEKFQDSNGIPRTIAATGLFYRSKIFGSRQTHRGEPESRRSDLESVIYLIIYLTKGLPWDNLAEFDSLSIILMKESATADVLCQNLPLGIRKYYVDVMGLGYCEIPDYDELRSYLEADLLQYRYADDDFEWTRRG